MIQKRRLNTMPCINTCRQSCPLHRKVLNGQLKCNHFERKKTTPISLFNDTSHISIKYRYIHT
ncbi:hypothetical protein Hanom_Chr09g00861331 [Helianthus anomalus]